jgi:transcriptional regulator with XRE-family HTH domain
MPKASSAIDTLPSAGAAALRKLGADLATARNRRKQSLREWAKRMNISVPTLMRMEKGDPSVSAGIYATALWLINRQEALAQAADPRHDLAALESEVSEARSRYRRQGDRDA